jgi:YYY domain-containing protein
VILQAIAWYLVVGAAGVVMTGALRRLGVGAGAGWAVGRVVGWTVQGYVAWLAGWAGLLNWWWVGLAVFLPLLAWGWRGLKELKPRALLEPELVGMGAFVLLSVLRLPALAVTGTEKPMDLAILATLLRPGTIPPADPWLAGGSLPYYYFGFVPWLLPAKLLGLAPDVVFNLLLPTLAAVCAQGAWAVARSLGGSRRTGVMAAFLVVFAGTFDGWRQLLAGVPLSGLDLWASSRAIKGTITEFPLFTFQLGDLHPHLLCVPLALAAIFLGRALGALPARWLPGVALGSLVYGAAAAANPWCAIPLGLAILLVVAGDETGFVRPQGPGLGLWLRVALLGAAGWVLLSPFWLSYHPPTRGLGLVTTPTRTDELALFLGGILLPPVLVAWELAWRWGGVELARRQFSRAAFLASVVLVAIVTGKVALALAIGLATVLAVTVLRGRARRARPVFALTLVPLGLLAFLEVVFLRDPYADEYYRMNTVFKASHLAFTLLAVVGPVLLGWLRRRRPALAVAAAALVLLAGLPQLVALTARALATPAAGWGGLGWMAPGEAAAASWLRTQPPGTVIVEGVGLAYTDAARMSAASGVPAVLGWEQHEGVWRGGAIGEETGRRKTEVEKLYRCGDPAQVRRIAQALGASVIVLGSVERRLYPGDALSAVLLGGNVAFRSEQCVLVSVGK